MKDNFPITATALTKPGQLSEVSRVPRDLALEYGARSPVEQRLHRACARNFCGRVRTRETTSTGKSTWNAKVNRNGPANAPMSRDRNLAACQCDTVRPGQSPFGPTPSDGPSYGLDWSFAAALCRMYAIALHRNGFQAASRASVLGTLERQF